MDSLKPLHTLRKEFGSIINAINATAGIHAASVALRRLNIATTNRYYADARRHIAPPIGAMLAAGSAPQPVVLDAPAESSAAKMEAKITPLAAAA